MRLAVRVRDLVLASWRTDRASVERAVYPGLEPAAIEGEHLVSIVAFRHAAARLGRLPVPSFAQLNVRTYVSYEGEPAVFFLRAYVTLAGLGGALFGAPYRPARIRVRPGRVEAPAAGVSLAYRLSERAQPGALGRHELGLFESAGLRALRIRRGAGEWLRGEPTEDARADVLLALGFELAGKPALFYASEASFETDVPPRKL